MYDIFRDNDSCVDVLHVGHYYIGVFYAPQTINIDNVFDTMGRLNAALSILDIKFKKNLDISSFRGRFSISRLNSILCFIYIGY